MKLVFKNTIRKISKTLGRFLSIFLIVTLGVGFFAGVRATNDDMLLTGDRYYDENHLMDFRIMSTMGLTEKDLKEVLKVDGVLDAYLGYTFDFLKDNNVLRVHSFNEHVNRVALVEGSYPTKIGECLAEDGIYHVGEKIVLSGDIDDKMKTKTFTVVGTITSPMYISFDKGITTIGNGKLHSYLYVLEDNFKLDYYTDMYLVMKDALSLHAYEKEYENQVAQLNDRLEALAPIMETRRYEELVKTLTLEIAKQEDQLINEEAKGKKELSKAKAELEDAKQELETASTRLASNRKMFEHAKKENQNKLKEASEQLEEGYRAYQKAYDEYRANKDQMTALLASKKEELAKTKNQLLALRQQIDALKENHPDDPNIAKLETQYSEGVKAWTAGVQQLEEQEKQFLNTPQILTETKKTLDQSAAQLEKNEILFHSEIQNTEKQLDAAEEEIKKNEKKYQDGVRTYQTNLLEFEEKIADAKKKIEEAKQEVRDLPQPEWYLFDRTDNIGYTDFKDDASRVNNIAKVFPIFFLLVAALVALNTMTRLIEEERTQIGIFKALGFSNFMISLNYILYSFTATFFGCVLGLIVGNYILPNAIFSVYSFTYTMPSLVVYISPLSFILITLCALFLMIGITVYTCHHSLSIEPANLMRPPAPKEGKKILLERIPLIWSHLSFSMKVTFRNVFRYKKRIYMTIIGIAGCTALMLTGFGLRDGVGNIVKNQYQKIFTYDATVFLEDKTKELPLETVRLLSDNAIAKPLLTYQVLGHVNADEKKSYETYLVAFKSDDSMNDYFQFHSFKTKKPITLEDDSAIITAKLAELLNIKAGDYLYFKDNENHSYAIKIKEVIENYIFHYIFMNDVYYQKISGEEISYNTIYGALTDDHYDTIASNLIKDDAIVNVNFTHDNVDRFGKIINGLNNIVAVILFSACLLAVVVLYNLATINITERIREIASLKVLGFYNKEVSSYIFREIYILTFIGIMVGLLVGIYLHRFVMATAEMDMIMFEKQIKPISYFFAALLSILFSFIVNLIINKKLKKVDMIESLKSVE